jgi:general stress protein CsbA
MHLSLKQILLLFNDLTRLKYVYLVLTRENLTVSSVTQDYASEFQAT